MRDFEPLSQSQQLFHKLILFMILRTLHLFVNDIWSRIMSDLWQMTMMSKKRSRKKTIRKEDNAIKENDASFENPP